MLESECELCFLLSESWDHSTLREDDLHAEAQSCRKCTDEIFHLPYCDRVSVDNLWVDVFNAFFLDLFLCFPYIVLY